MLLPQQLWGKLSTFDCPGVKNHIFCLEVRRSSTLTFEEIQNIVSADRWESNAVTFLLSRRDITSAMVDQQPSYLDGDERLRHGTTTTDESITGPLFVAHHRCDSRVLARGTTKTNVLSVAADDGSTFALFVWKSLPIMKRYLVTLILPPRYDTAFSVKFSSSVSRSVFSSHIVSLFIAMSSPCPTFKTHFFHLWLFHPFGFPFFHRGTVPPDICDAKARMFHIYPVSFDRSCTVSCQFVVQNVCSVSFIGQNFHIYSLAEIFGHMPAR